MKVEESTEIYADAAEMAGTDLIVQCVTMSEISPPQPIEVHGETSTLAVPDPNYFDGEVRVFDLGDGEWRLLHASAGYAAGSRGIVLLDQIAAHGRPPRAGGDLALHVLEAMTALLRSAGDGRRIELTTTAERPSPVP